MACCLPALAGISSLGERDGQRFLIGLDGRPDEWSRGPLPGVVTLQQDYGVGRNTVLRAIAILRDDKLVFTVKRRGTYVTPRTSPGQPQSD
jgi:hypothetical protein